MHAFSMMSDGFFLSLSLCLDIGLVNVAMISLTLSHGFKPGFWLGLGSCIGDLIYAALALAGMAALAAVRIGALGGVDRRRGDPALPDLEDGA